jgi:DNA-binding beta-propeller fold protein YncE
MFGGKSDSDQAGGTALIDLGTQKITKTIIAGGAHRHAVRLRTGKDVFAVSDMAKSRVYFIENYKKVAETKVFSNPNTIVESPDGKYLYVSCRGHNNPKSFLIKGPDFGKVMVIDLSTRKVIEEIEGGNQPTGLDVSPDGKYVVSTDFLDHAMRVYERSQ